MLFLYSLCSKCCWAQPSCNPLSCSLPSRTNLTWKDLNNTWHPQLQQKNKIQKQKNSQVPEFQRFPIITTSHSSMYTTFLCTQPQRKTVLGAKKYPRKQDSQGLVSESRQRGTCLSLNTMCMDRGVEWWLYNWVIVFVFSGRTENRFVEFMLQCEPVSKQERGQYLLLPKLKIKGWNQVLNHLDQKEQEWEHSKQELPEGERGKYFKEL
jgi:hypothetical protein